MASSLRDALDKHDLYARARGFSPATMDHTRRSVTLFDDFLGGKKDVADVTALDFRRFVADLRERPNRNLDRGGKTRKLSGTSINTYARAIKAFFAWLKADGLIETNPMESEPAPKKPRTIPKVYTEGELNAFVRAVTGNLRNTAIFFLFLDPGLRLSELSGLPIGNVDTGNREARIVGKGGKERTVPLHPLAAAAVDDYARRARPVPKNTDRLFLTDQGTPFSAHGVQSMLARLGREAGIQETLSPHKLRHSFATRSLKYGGNLEYIKAILGHSDIKTTSNSYLNVDLTDVKAAHEEFSPLSNLITEPTARRQQGLPGLQHRPAVGRIQKQR